MKAGDIVRFKEPYEEELGLLFVLMDEPQAVLSHIAWFRFTHPFWQPPSPFVDIKLLRDRHGNIQQGGMFTPRQSVLLPDLELVAEVPKAPHLYTCPGSQTSPSNDSGTLKIYEGCLYYQ